MTKHLCLRQARGFTLIEMAIVLVIIGLLLGGLLVPLSNQVESEKRADTEETLEAITETLIGFAMLNGRLPCPDTTPAPDGTENAPCGTALNLTATGNLPWATLNLNAGQDGWYQNLGYTVIQTFTNAATFSANYTNTAGWTNVLTVYDAANCGAGPGAAISLTVPAIITSSGKPKDPAATSVHENENTDGDGCFANRDFSDVAGTEFNDILAWISPNILYTRMVSAGRLP